MQVFYGEFENEKKKGQNFFDLPVWGFEPQIFSNFPAHNFDLLLIDLEQHTFLIKSTSVQDIR